MFCDTWAQAVNELSVLAKDSDAACHGRVLADKAAYMSLPKPGVTTTPTFSRVAESLRGVRAGFTGSLPNVSSMGGGSLKRPTELMGISSVVATRRRVLNAMEDMERSVTKSASNTSSSPDSGMSDGVAQGKTPISPMADATISLGSPDGMGTSLTDSGVSVQQEPLITPIMERYRNKARLDKSTARFEYRISQIIEELHVDSFNTSLSPGLTPIGDVSSADSSRVFNFEGVSAVGGSSNATFDGSLESTPSTSFVYRESSGAKMVVAKKLAKSEAELEAELAKELENLMVGMG